MAARAEFPDKLEVLDLRYFQSRDLESLLEEEIQIWARDLRWDYHPSADMVRRYVDMRALAGLALLRAGRPVGYAYYVPEDHKALIGNLFVSSPFRTIEAQHLLLEQVVETARQAPGIRRIEAQLVMLESAEAASLYPPEELSMFERNFMLLEGLQSLQWAPASISRASEISFQTWSEQYMESAALLIARSYHQHVDSRINDQYRSVGGARRFLHNITQYPVCGAFHPAAAVVAFDLALGDLCGISLASLVQARVGHITQLCVSPPRRGSGVGSELLWRTLKVFRRLGGEAVSLTVSEANAGAVRLYERIGFRTIRRFHAYVWEGWR